MKNIIKSIPFLLLYTGILFSASRLQAQSSVSATCWAQLMDANDIPFTGAENLGIEKGIRVADGFILCGNASETIFPSRNGDTVGRTDFGGPFIAKYDFSGNLIWLDYGKADNFGFNIGYYNSIKSVSADSSGAIYIVGNMPVTAYFFYNHGQDSVRISALNNSVQPENRDFIAKLNPQGIPVWHTTTYGTAISLVTSLPDKGIVVAGSIEYYGAGYVKNSDTTNTFQFSTPWPGHMQFLYWIDSLGNLKKYTYTVEQATNEHGFDHMEADAQGNVIIAGRYEKKATFYDVGHTDSTVIAEANQTMYGEKLYVVKYDTAGKVIWKVRDQGSLGFSQPNTGSSPLDMCLGKDGEIYVLSRNGFVGFPSDTLYFFNADSSIISLKKGYTNLYCIDKNGILKWGTRQYADYGHTIGASDSGVVFAGSHAFNYGVPVGFSDTLYSANNQANFVVNVDNPTLFFVKYDTAGTIHDGGAIGISNGYVQYHLNIVSAPDDSWILFGDVSQLNQTHHVKFYNDSLAFNGGGDNFMLRYKFNICDSLTESEGIHEVAILPTTQDTACTGTNLIVYHSLTGQYTGDTWYEVQLSEPNGIFPYNPQQLALSYTPVPYFVCLIPANIPPGNQYRVRVTTHNPLRYSQEYPLSIFNTSPATVTLTASPGSIITPGSTVTFKAHPTNGGIQPNYKWLINNQEMQNGTQDTFITNALSGGEVVTVNMTSDVVCAQPQISTHSITMGSTGINNLSEEGNVRVYPNPVKNILALHGSIPVHNGVLTIAIKDLLGKNIHEEVIRANNTFQHQINLPDNITPGTYILELSSDGYKMNTKIVILK